MVTLAGDNKPTALIHVSSHALTFYQKQFAIYTHNEQLGGVSL